MVTFAKKVEKAPTLNPDGVSVFGCKYIYAPKGQAGEYAPLATNPYRGCGHSCAYCYVPLITQQPRAEFNAGAVLRANYLDNLIKDAAKYEMLGVTEQVMFSFTTDPYHPGDTTATRAAINVLRDHGLAFCTLSKGGTRALRDIHLFRPARDAYACTLTSLDVKFQKKWEPDAAAPDDRIAALKAFHKRGIFTWVSLEPTLNVEASAEIVREIHPYVDLFKIGRANYLPMTATTDWESYTLKMIDLCADVGATCYIKKDLQPYLPVGFHNPMRRPQHH